MIIEIANAQGWKRWAGLKKPWKPQTVFKNPAWNERVRNQTKILHPAYGKHYSILHKVMVTCELHRASVAFWFSLTPSMQINAINRQDSGCLKSVSVISGGSWLISADVLQPLVANSVTSTSREGLCSFCQGAFVFFLSPYTYFSICAKCRQDFLAGCLPVLVTIK